MKRGWKRGTENTEITRKRWKRREVEEEILRKSKKFSRKSERMNVGKAVRTSSNSSRFL
jgi:hypothetical protein